MYLQNLSTSHGPMAGQEQWMSAYKTKAQANAQEKWTGQKLKKNSQAKCTRKRHKTKAQANAQEKWTGQKQLQASKIKTRNARLFFKATTNQNPKKCQQSMVLCLKAQMNTPETILFKLQIPKAQNPANAQNPAKGSKSCSTMEHATKTQNCGISFVSNITLD